MSVRFPDFEEEPDLEAEPASQEDFEEDEAEDMGWFEAAEDDQLAAFEPMEPEEEEHGAIEDADAPSVAEAMEPFPEDSQFPELLNDSQFSEEELAEPVMDKSGEVGGHRPVARPLAGELAGDEDCVICMDAPAASSAGSPETKAEKIQKLKALLKQMEELEHDVGRAEDEVKTAVGEIKGSCPQICLGGGELLALKVKVCEWWLRFLICYFSSCHKFIKFACTDLCLPVSTPPDCLHFCPSHLNASFLKVWH